MLVVRDDRAAATLARWDDLERGACTRHTLAVTLACVGCTGAYTLCPIGGVDVHHLAPLAILVPSRAASRSTLSPPTSDHTERQRRAHEPSRFGGAD